MRMGSEIGHKARKHDDVVVKVQCVCIGQEAEGLVVFATDREKVLSFHESVTTTLSEWDGCVRNYDPSPFAITTISVESPLADSGGPHCNDLLADDGMTELGSVITRGNVTFKRFSTSFLSHRSSTLCIASSAGVPSIVRRDNESPKAKDKISFCELQT